MDPELEEDVEAILDEGTDISFLEDDSLDFQEVLEKALEVAGAAEGQEDPFEAAVEAVLNPADDEPGGLEDSSSELPEGEESEESEGGEDADDEALKDEDSADEDADSDSLEDSDESEESEDPPQASQEVADLRAELQDLRAVLRAQRAPKAPEPAPIPAEYAQDKDLFQRAQFGQGIDADEVQKLDLQAKQRLQANLKNFAEREADYAFDPELRYRDQFQDLVEAQIAKHVAPLVRAHDERQAEADFAPVEATFGKLDANDPIYSELRTQAKRMGLASQPRDQQREILRAICEDIRDRRAAKKPSAPPNQKTRADSRRGRRRKGGPAKPRRVPRDPKAVVLPSLAGEFDTFAMAAALTAQERKNGTASR